MLIPATAEEYDRRALMVFQKDIQFFSLSG